MVQGPERPMPAGTLRGTGPEDSGAYGLNELESCDGPTCWPAALIAMVCALTISIGLAGGHRPVPGAKTPAARELVVKDRLCRLSLVRVPVLDDEFAGGRRF